MSELCGEPHPDKSEVRCDKTVPCYGYHSSVPYDLTWPGNPKPRKRADGGKLKDIKARALVRNTDPGTAHEAIERYKPKRDTAKGRVLAYLQEREGVWVDAPELTTQEVGGFAGTRRLRELRDAGWPIETRPKPDAENTWQHRLVEG